MMDMNNTSIVIRSVCMLHALQRRGASLIVASRARLWLMKESQAARMVMDEAAEEQKGNEKG